MTGIEYCQTCGAHLPAGDPHGVDGELVWRDRRIAELEAERDRYRDQGRAIIDALWNLPVIELRAEWIDKDQGRVAQRRVWEAVRKWGSS